MSELMSVEEARKLLLSKVGVLRPVVVALLDGAQRVAACDVRSDGDVAPFAHAAMDGFALRAKQIATASDTSVVALDVVAEVAAGDTYDGGLDKGQCVRIMTGAPLPFCADAVVPYEVVRTLQGNGRLGSRVGFTQPVEVGASVRPAGEEARAGDVVVHQGEVIHAAGVGFLASCGIVEVPVYASPKVAIISIGSELVEPTEIPTPGKIRNSNSYALAAAARSAGAVVSILPIVEDTHEALSVALQKATKSYDCVITSGGASNGDFDYIKPVVSDLGTLLMTTVNMRPGKAQTFGIVAGTPVFGLPGNPAAAYVGFEVLVRPALRKMQGFTHFERPSVKAVLTHDAKKKDPRRIFMRATLTKTKGGTYEVTPAQNQSSGLFGPLQKSNCMAILPEGPRSRTAGSIIECVLLDVDEEVCI